MAKYRKGVRVLVSASKLTEQEWQRHMLTRRTIAALKAWDMPDEQCAAMLREERARHRAQVKAHYELYHYVLVQRYAEQAEKKAQEELAKQEMYKHDLCFGYREERRNKVLALREALAGSRITLKVYYRLEKEAQLYCNAMIKHARKVKAMEDRLPAKPYIRKREERNRTT
jgi:hypothetical protein